LRGSKKYVQNAFNPGNLKKTLFWTGVSMVGITALTIAVSPMVPVVAFTGFAILSAAQIAQNSYQANRALNTAKTKVERMAAWENATGVVLDAAATTALTVVCARPALSSARMMPQNGAPLSRLEATERLFRFTPSAVKDVQRNANPKNVAENLSRFHQSSVAGLFSGNTVTRNAAKASLFSLIPNTRNLGKSLMDELFNGQSSTTRSTPSNSN
jgi:hypothetical protein